MGIVGPPINPRKVRRQISPSSYLSDLMGLHKSVQLCSACEFKMPRNWQQRYHYDELTAAHAIGDCDGCRKADRTLTLFLSQEDPWYAACQKQAAIARAIQDADQRFLVNDKRRVR